MKAKSVCMCARVFKHVKLLFVHVLSGLWEVQWHRTLSSDESGSSRCREWSKHVAWWCIDAEASQEATQCQATVGHQRPFVWCRGKVVEFDFFGKRLIYCDGLLTDHRFLIWHHWQTNSNNDNSTLHRVCAGFRTCLATPRVVMLRGCGWCCWLLESLPMAAVPLPFCNFHRALGLAVMPACPR